MKTNWIKHFKSNKRPKYYIAKFLKFKVGTKLKLLSKIILKFDELDKKSKRSLKRLLTKNKRLFNVNIRLKGIRKLLLVQYIKDKKVKVKKIIKIFDKLKYYSVGFVRSIFKEFKKINISVKTQLRILKRFRSRLHSITLMRVEEYIKFNKLSD